MASARRWALFGLSLLSLVLMTYGGVLLAFSVPVNDAMMEANDDLPRSGRALLVPVTDPSSVATHAADGEGTFLVAGAHGTFPAGTTNATLRRALVHVHEVAEGVYEPAQVTLVGVASANGTSDMTLDVATIARGGSGWIVMGSREAAPTFYTSEEVVGQVVRFSSGGTIGLMFGAGLAGFVAPLVVLILTHKPSGARGAPAHLCRECGSPFPSNVDFCLRCGAYRAREEA